MQTQDPAATPNTAPTGLSTLGVFDSGVGGLSVLRALHALRPDAELIYVADSGHAPYGERDDAYVVRRSERVAAWLIETGVELLVVACNTATAAAVHRLRERWPELPIVGVEPGLKPAVAASAKRRIGVLATPSTLRSGKFQRLLEAHAVDAEVHLQPCPGLAALIEQGELDAPSLVAMIDAYCAPLRSAGVDAVVLGCTHYAFVAHHIQTAMGSGVTLIDTADAVARHAARLAASRSSQAGSRPSSDDRSLRLVTTGDADLLRRVAGDWLDFACATEARAI
jgi:glutamate racemase